MIELKEVIQFWTTYLNTHEQNLSDHHYQIVNSTNRHLADYKKLKEQVNGKLNLGPNSPTRLKR